MHAGRLVIIGGYRNMSLHEPDQQDQPAVARTHQAATSRVDCEFVARIRSRYTNRLDPATPNQAPVEGPILMAGRRSWAHRDVGTLRKRGWRLTPSRCAVELRGSLRPETVAGHQLAFFW